MKVSNLHDDQEKFKAIGGCHCHGCYYYSRGWFDSMIEMNRTLFNSDNRSIIMNMFKDEK